MIDPAIIEAAARALQGELISNSPLREPPTWNGIATAVLAAVTPLIEATLERRATTVVEGEMTPEILSWAESVLDAEAVRVIEAATLEKAAKVVEDEDGNYSWAGEHRNMALLQQHNRELAAAIRALKEQP